MSSEVFRAIQITGHVYWVGAIDWAVRDFHGYATSRGTTYNAYLIVKDGITLVDTVKAPFRDELMARIESVVDPSDITTIISNHSEMDHSGCLSETIETVKPDVVYASQMGTKALKEHYGLEGIEAVKSGQTIEISGMDVTFVETRMLHWPDSMVSWLPEEKLLFSQDAFGMHLASYERFADELDAGIIRQEAEKYYANILLPYSKIIPNALKKVDEAGIEPAVVAPDHGPIWRTPEGIEGIRKWYGEWAAQKPARKAVVVYDTMWGSTDIMARAIGEGFDAEDVTVKLMPMGSNHRSDVATEILEAGALVVGSPTLNNGMFPTLPECLSYIKGLKPQNLIGAVFGSYGWSGESVKLLEEYLDSMGIELAAGSVSSKYVPDRETLTQCRDLGAAVAKKLKEATS